MSPNNQNEYEIIDAAPSTSGTNDSNRYPFANEPTNALQNMNYKDYLRISEDNNPYYPEGYETFMDTGKAIGLGFKILGTVFQALGVPGASAVGGLLNIVIPLLFPGPDPWEAFMAQVEQLINQKIEENTRNTAIARLQGLSNSIDVYVKSLENLLENPNDIRARNVVQTQYISLEIDFNNSMPLFAILGQEVPLLAVYAQAAGLHLMLLRDATIHGEAMGLTQSEITIYYNRQVQYTAKYTDHCVKWYQTGLERLKGTNAEQWVKYNRFRREMTIMVLDTIYLYPFYDPHLYPIGTQPQLTRIIYTDPLGYAVTGNLGAWPPWYNNGRSFAEIENEAILPPGSFKVLTKFTIYTRRSADANFKKYYWAGHKMYQRSLYNSFLLERTSGNTSSPTSTQNISLDNQDVYRVKSDMTTYWNLLNAPYNLMVVKAQFDTINTNNGLSTINYVAANESYDKVEHRDSSNELPISVASPTKYGDVNQYSHRLTSVSDAPLKSYNYGLVPVLGWTHTSVTFQSIIDPKIITQFPMVKFVDTPVVAGPGFTGGDVVRFTTSQEKKWSIRVHYEGSSFQKFRIRIRYASDKAANLKISSKSVENPSTYETTIALKKSMDTTTDLTYNNFVYAESSPINLGNPGSSRNFDITLTKEATSSITNSYFDKIEFIPVDATYEAETDLEAAKKAVNALFTNTKDGLRPGVTDYEVNQAANLVECLSDDLYPNEKRLLFDAVREAKRLSEARNLLQDPDFQEINGENGWTASTGIEVVEGDALFKGRYLRLPGAREIDTETYPTYLYQKVEEGVLKPYTRYRLRGFVGSSQGLEIFTIRHQTNRIVKNVPDDLLPDVPPVNSDGRINRCSEQKYVNGRLEGENRSAEAHEFSLPIDTGEIDYNENAGIWVGFKITAPEGYATLGNLELVEEGPLSGDALERLKREEQQWKIQMTRRREETDRRYMASKQAIDRLYADYQDQQLNPNVEITDLTAAQDLIQSIPYVYNEMFPEIPGMNYTKFTELTDRLQQAWSLYDQRNAISNGDFRNGLSNWNATPGVEVQQINNTSVLVIPNWDEQVSQQFTVQPNQRYVLRVTARKEGVGNGYVSIRDGGNQSETLTFSASDYDTNGMYDTQVSNTNGYNTNNAYNTQASNTSGYNTNNAYNTQASNTNEYNVNNMYNMQASNTNEYNTNSVYNDQTGYITKTVTFIPYTGQMWIEISETEGTFYIESVELIVDVE
ncbi:TPA: pesticidal protein [Bacillus cereus]|nr:pesticidal protein [Bacillus cereus]